MRYLLAILLLTVAVPATAQEWGWRTYCNPSRTHCYDRRVRLYAPRVYSYERRAEENWERRDPSVERGEHCKDEMVRVVGGLQLTKEGALNDAVRQWQSTVRYDHGERYMDIESARGYVWRCDRAGTNETLAGRVGEMVTGGSGFQRRCVVTARPCRMPVIKGDKDER